MENVLLRSPDPEGLRGAQDASPWPPSPGPDPAPPGCSFGRAALVRLEEEEGQQRRVEGNPESRATRSRAAFRPPPASFSPCQAVRARMWARGDVPVRLALLLR
ncbi:UNVERIFIED_CONTAM: hypothetical protein K2H54_053930, partial [Gekko kuhli]